ncbi:nuclear transport factor 2 family protein [Curvibacter sp. RS43]|uniref:nuclear transport factor 2 family protein n=1 Tax=Curvibacter microcysteis TaxID=3026419 RepID=UPI002360EFBC|nr:nuclear transport factor 2 family protein [Curvibacter sp. RS43]MDD0808715.1 nuclear transport factor 2 family protein [Curvibacter sp. RS43]
MNIRQRVAVLGLWGAALLAPVAGWAQISPDEQAVAQAVEQLRVLMVDPERNRLEALLSDSLSYGHSAGRLDTRESFVADLLAARSDFTHIELSEQTVRLSGDVAVVRHRLTGGTLDAGKPGQVDLKILLVWQKQGGAWKLLARQAVRVPS